MQNIYLENVTLDDALDNYLSHLTPFPLTVGQVPVTDALGRVTSHAVFAANNSPLYDCAAMDGIAVVSRHTQGAREVSPVTLKHGQDFVYVDTGDPVLPPYDAVIMVEEVQKAGNDVIIRKAAVSYQHIRAIGEDVVKNELIIPTGRKIRPVDIGALLSGGITSVSVKAQPIIAVIPTGSELIEPGDEIKTGSIIESNSRMLEALIQEDGCQPCRFPIVPDIETELRETLKHAAAACDMVLLCSGTSAGREDYTRKIIEELGEVVTHGVAIKPGKPAILAIIGGKPVIGVPGYPVSAYIVYKNIISPIIKSLQHMDREHPATIEATLTRRLVSSVKHKEFVRVKLGKINGRFIATPLSRGAGAGMSLVRADGFCVIDQDLEGLEAGATVQISLLRDLAGIEKTVISIGSHDIIMDILSDLMGTDICLSSSHVGTIGGLMALKNKECHIAPIHHLDEATGTYNVNIIKQLFPGRQMALIKGVQRVQGIMVAKGNPLNITGVADVKRCRYVNRSRGTGTRMFLDYQLKLAGIPPENINGYDREVSTHMNVGGIIANGGADAGLGVMSAALACSPDFVPIGVEDYDFALFANTLDNEYVKVFIHHLKSEKFRKKLNELGGYTATNCGEVVIIE
ncbi:MAG: molybdopterin biosynthesis protein [Firmicutes bacterium]|nr:molybdopterin biosynthesis protein [Bacillota bacterium]